ncbi:unnamed protein product, partial [Prorocentrum cordatum]
TIIAGSSLLFGGREAACTAGFQPSDGPPCARRRRPPACGSELRRRGGHDHRRGGAAPGDHRSADQHGARVRGAPTEPVSAAPRTGGLRPVFFALLALVLAGNGCAAVEDTTTVGEERRLETTEAPTSTEPVSAAPRTRGLRPVFCALLALVLAGNGCAAVEDTTTVGEERRLETTEAPTSTEPVSAAPRTRGLGPMIVVGAALGLGARR